MKKAVASLALALATCAGGHAWRAPVQVSYDAGSVRGTSAGQRVPEGFLLPASDVNLGISSLVTADLDADGDLDVVAAENTAGTLGIVVWVNDGAGHLTRKQPGLPRNTGLAPSSPSFDERQSTAFVSIQNGSHAVAATDAGQWILLPAQPYHLALSAAAISIAPGSLSSRSPPAVLRLS